MSRVQNGPHGGYRINSGRTPSTRLSDEQELLIIECSAANLSVNETAEKVGVSSRTIVRRRAAFAADAATDRRE